MAYLRRWLFYFDIPHLAMAVFDTQKKSGKDENLRVCYKLHNECFVRRDAITNLANYLRLLMAFGLNIYLSKGAICNTHKSTLLL